MESEAGPQPADFVQSVGRAMLILEVVGRCPGLPVKAIARRCSLNLSTTYHLVRTLAYEGYLVRLPDGSGVEELLTQLRDLAGLGFQSVLGYVPDVHTLRPLEVLGDRVIPEAASF